MSQIEYEKLKRSVSGFYQKFNTTILKWHINKIFDYKYLLETAVQYETFEDYYYFHTKEKAEVISEHVNQMMDESVNKVEGTTEALIRTCILVRLGNVYHGMVMENRIIETFNRLEPWILCEKTEKEIDTNYKVDGIVTFIGIDQIAIQIKPVSFTKYDRGSEIGAHNKFTTEFGIEVYYVFYKDKDTIQFNGIDVKLNEKGKIVEILETLVYSN